MHELTVVARFKVLKVEAGGDVVLEMNPLRARFVSQAPPPLLPPDLLEGCLLQVRLDKDAVCVKVDGLNPIAQAQAGAASGPAFDLVQGELEKSVRSWVGTMFPRLPAKAMKPGESWRLPVRDDKTGPLIRAIDLTLDKAPAAAETLTLRTSGKVTLTDPLVHLARQQLAGQVDYDPKLGRATYFIAQLDFAIESTQRTPTGKVDVYQETHALEECRLHAENPLDRKVPDVSPRKLEPRNNSLGMKLVPIPAGRFTMGSSADPRNEQEHEVVLTRPFLMGAHEVTIGQYKRFVADTGYRTRAELIGRCVGWDSELKKLVPDPRFSWKHPGWDVTDEHPVVNLTWDDAKAFCEWLSKKEGKAYRLPTEAEWEYACRAGTRTRFHSGDDPETLIGFGNIVDAQAKKLFPDWQAIQGDDGFAFTSPVGSFKPNAWGLYDMHGNALEWCEDWHWAPDQGRVVDPVGPPIGSLKVQRGGSWADFGYQSTASRRVGFGPENSCISSGFRVVQADGPLLPKRTLSETWAGRKVLPRSLDIEVLVTDGPTPRILHGLQHPVVYVLHDERAGLVNGFGAQRALLAKKDVVPLEEAVAVYSDAIKTDPEAASPYRLRALAYRELGKQDEAVADLETAVKLAPKNAFLRIDRARVFAGLKEWRRAQDEWQAAVEIEPNNPWAHNGLAWLLATCPEKEIRDGPRAVEHANKAKELMLIAEGNILDTLAAANAEAGNFEQAVRFESDALADPQYRLISGEGPQRRLEMYRKGTPFREK
ncbi:MAG: SUMF1/EgtB/PvdO family nonheme iron enzyme [Gemmataceae bacterium]